MQHAQSTEAALNNVDEPGETTEWLKETASEFNWLYDLIIFRWIQE